ncbi:trans-aconitate 2-methyltransferase [Azorhizobium oxalatiphilum]|uniref:trans-aconitate 2-methyltransferase n=1 Tax=Azorhizobium oxalatiphilum TaxID=980631 RepID=UPI001663E9B6|nr:trans-aconitate 2-methyltransferase [Azorhizobium oxalatiphilum]
MADWNARLYLSFEDQRTRPARDLVAQIPLDAARRVVDLGCGPGNSTELLAARYPEAEVIGIDTSPDMLATARRRLPHTTFIEADVATYSLPQPADIILANAVLQWVPDHQALFPRLLGQLSEGGVLAVQMPDNLNEPTHAGMRKVASEGPWAAKLAEATTARTVLPPASQYYDLLAPLATRVDIWRTTYHHPLESPTAVVEWMKGTGLRPFLDPLDKDEQAAFLAAYEAQIAQDYPPRTDGKVLLAFPRLFIIAGR